MGLYLCQCLDQNGQRSDRVQNTLRVASEWFRRGCSGQPLHHPNEKAILVGRQTKLAARLRCERHQTLL